MRPNNACLTKRNYVICFRYPNMQFLNNTHVRSLPDTWKYLHNLHIGSTLHVLALRATKSRAFEVTRKLSVPMGYLSAAWSPNIMHLSSRKFILVRNLSSLLASRNKLRSCADKFSLHCNIFIYIRHIWIKPVLCSRMVSLFHHTSPWTHRCLQCSHSSHRNGRVFRRSVQTACCYCILNRGKSSSNWYSQTNASRLW